MSDARFEEDATRVTEWGRERALFLGEPGDRMFAVIHTPAQPPTGAVLVCSSLFTDTLFNYRREVEVARILARSGFLVGRFHYRGTGQSEGDPGLLTQSAMISDALRLADHISEVAGALRIGWLGSRWGALVAAGGSARYEQAPLAVWEPVLEGRAFLREALQASGVAHMASQLGGLSPKQSLESNGVANILGFPMGRALFDSGVNLSLVGLIGAPPRPVLYLGPGQGTTLARKDQEAVERLRMGGFQVSAQPIAGPKAWWFVDEVHPTPLDAAAVTAEWFRAGLEDAR